MPILYVCESCRDNSPETCGHENRDELRAGTDGKWICQGCYYDAVRGGETSWSQLPAVPEYAPQGPL